MRSKPLLVAVGLTAVLMGLVFFAGWLFGSRSGEDAAAVPAPPRASAGAQWHPDSLLEPQIDAIRRGVPVDQEGSPPPLARVENADLKRVRAYPMQPPTIPHTIDGYQVDKNSNRCMLCHARANAATFQAPPVSVTHYMDRDDQFLATISPRRYFCSQCHVVQTDAQPLVASGFQDIDSLISAQPGSE
ncbi:nitrate reductase cytochrome c-type subunit [Pseudoxanthomonas wuyuanensis]|uniref:Periplasmic nitrate reductase, electron transfer subunit n=1 Tax=Pseudoxanthomonas wuyuanensis TaxID=1073196 RepID=A0A286CZ48_9GAMM|nr:nitrate reductase cytochrome c-type subunit [Pseudoxanthomonas wuyuanensis]KAF1722288.1 nitrate reductase cytochrome c-type subunit; periplasmic nitrate reductase electron transfer subunit [Pseudoxanthomonas wuyuanensis]SOD51678.1 cytochrome c-type protein NapB [Pseudoxanthomonas wuyuanensis]